MEFLASNWLYIVFAGIMIFMMTKGGGCCGGHSHGEGTQDGNSQSGGCCGGHSHSNHSGEIHGHDDSQSEINQLETVKDPICGMSVNPDTAIKQIINDKTYYFCSESCRKEFVRKQNIL